MCIKKTCIEANIAHMCIPFEVAFLIATISITIPGNQTGQC